MFNPTGTDTHEFIEVKGDPSTDYTGWSLVVIDGDLPNAAGKIDNIYNLGTTDADGYWVTPYGSNVLQNGSQTVLLVKDFTGTLGQDLDPDKDGVLNTTPWSTIADSIAVRDSDATDPAYAGAPVLTGAAAAGASRIPDGHDTDSASDWVTNDPSLAGIDGYGTAAAKGTVLNTPGAANDSADAGGSAGGGGDDTGGTGGNTGGDNGGGSDTTTPLTLTIQQLNGDSYTSPYNRKTVQTTGVVTAVDTTGGKGYWIQDPSPDASHVGSSGLFVLAATGATLPSVGQTVTVTGLMENYSGTSWSNSLPVSEIVETSHSVADTAAVSITPTVIGEGGLTVPTEAYTGTDTNLNTSTATLQPDANALDFYRSLVGQVVTIHNAVVVGATASNATWVVPDGGDGLLNSRGALIESADNINTQRIEVYYDSGVTPGDAISATLGDSLGDVTGVLNYYNGVYELEPISAVTVTPAAPPQQTTNFLKDQTHLLVADYNIENFDALDPTQADRLSQLATIITQNLNAPDVLALQEVQDDSGTANDGTVDATQNIEAIIAAIAAAGGPTYAYAEIDPVNGAEGGVAGGNIRNVFLYNPERVSLVGDVSRIGTDASTTTFKNTRLPLVGTFEFNGQDVTLINVHNSSQAGSSELYGSTQPPVNHGGGTPADDVNGRQAQAEYITDYVKTLLQSDPTAKVGVLGDFNDVAWSDTQQIYTGSGVLTDMEGHEDPDNRYTYVFEGNAESLDHTLVSSTFYEDSDFETVHVNAEYQDSVRESDHDPSLSFVDLATYVINDGQTLLSTTILSGQTLDVNKGGLVSNIQVNANARASILSGGTARNTVVETGGVLALAGGAIVTGTVLSIGSSLDLTDIVYGSGATVMLQGTSTLVVTTASTTLTFELTGDYSKDYFVMAQDGYGGMTITDQGTPCYCRGTLIRTSSGDVAVEDLQIGDHVVTASGLSRPIRWIGTRSYSGQFASGNQDILPVIIRKGALGENLPARDLSVSPLHAMYLNGVLIPALALVNGDTILQAGQIDEVAYFHIELETHDIILAEGAPSETFIDDDSRGMFHNAAEFATLYPNAPRIPAQYCAPRVESGPELEAARHAINARRSMPSATEAPLSGFIDEVSREHIAGWAHDNTGQPVDLEIVINGVVISTVSASTWRSDLEQAGFGNGCCGFSRTIPGGLAPALRHVIEVRRASDGKALAHSPWFIDLPDATALPASSGPLRGHLDIVTRDRIAGWAADDSNAAVALQILDNGMVLSRTIANADRNDLRQSGIGDGRHGFDLTLPVPLSPLTRHVVQVVRESDGAEIAGSPFVLESATRFDDALETAVAKAVQALDSSADLEHVYSFMMAQAEALRQRQANEQSGATARDHARRLLRTQGPAAPRSVLETLTRRRTLVIDALTPDATRDAGSQAILSHMRALKTLGYDITFIAADDLSPAEPLREALTAQGIETCTAPFTSSVEDVLRRHAHSFDVVYLHRHDIATRYMPLVRRHQNRARVIYSVADLHHLRLERQAAAENRPELLATARQVRLEECTAAWSADAVLTHSLRELSLLRAMVPDATVHHVPWHVPLRPGARPFEERSGVAFIGSFTHAPNLDAARFLVSSVMPLVRRQHPEISFLLAGSQMPDAIYRLRQDGVTIAGYVPDLHTLLDQVRLTVAPLRYGAGIKGKVLDSLASGVPCVMSTIAAEGMILPPELSALTGTDARELAAQIIRLYTDKAAHTVAASAGEHYIRNHTSEDTVTEALRDAIEGRTAMQQAV
nr:Hint domain-containing protein [Acetobacter musti]